MKLFWLMTIFLTGCLLVTCSLDSRVKIERAVIETRSIRDAEREFKKTFGRYASMDELISRNLIPFRPGTGLTSDFLYECQADDNSYELTVREKALPNKGNDDDSLSLYVDQSGVIRGAYDAKTVANRSSIPIGVQ